MWKQAATYRDYGKDFDIELPEGEKNAGCAPIHR
jgi:hypothetical protein